LKSQPAIGLIPRIQKHLKSLGFFLQKHWLEFALIGAGGLGLWLGSQQLPLLTQSQQFQTSISTLQGKLNKTSLPDKDHLSLEKDLLALQKDRITLENTIRTSQLQGIGGLLLVITAYVGWQNYQATQQKQVAERFSKAIDQLDNDKDIHVRLGAIYALEQIAKDAEKQYYWPVMEILTAYVRGKTALPPKDEHPDAPSVEEYREAMVDSEHKFSNPLPDVQAVLTVLSRRKYSYKSPQEPHRLDLHGIDLTNIDLRDAENLKGLNLKGSRLWFAKLERASLDGADLESADLWRANLKRSILEQTSLQGADLTSANLRGSCFKGTNFSAAKLKWTNLKR
jgi:hypothetical protein